MQNNGQFKRTLRADVKRSIRILPGFFLTSMLFVIIAGMIVVYAKYFVFDKEIFTSVKVAYYVDTDDELGKNQIDIIRNMDSVKESAQLIPVDSEEEGIRMMKDEEVTALLIVPNDFVSDMGSEDSAIRVYYNGDDSFESYLVNDIVIIISELYGKARNAVLTYKQVAADFGFDTEAIDKGYNTLNTRLLSEVFSRTEGYETVEIDSSGMYTLSQSLIAAMVILIMFLMCFQLTGFYKGYNNSFKMIQKMTGMSKLKLALSRLICGSTLLFALYIFMFVLIWLFKKETKVSSIITIIPVLILISGITLLLSEIISSEYVVNIVIFLGVVTLLYLAGGFVPMVMMPRFVHSLAPWNPMTYVLKYMMFILY